MTDSRNLSASTSSPSTLTHNQNRINKSATSLLGLMLESPKHMLNSLSVHLTPHADFKQNNTFQRSPSQTATSIHALLSTECTLLPDNVNRLDESCLLVDNMLMIGDRREVRSKSLNSDCRLIARQNQANSNNCDFWSPADLLAKRRAHSLQPPSPAFRTTMENTGNLLYLLLTLHLNIIWVKQTSNDLHSLKRAHKILR